MGWPNGWSHGNVKQFRRYTIIFSTLGFKFLLILSGSIVQSNLCAKLKPFTSDSTVKVRGISLQIVFYIK